MSEQKRIPYTIMKTEFKRVLHGLRFPEEKAELCAEIFASNSRDGVYSHGLNRFPTFVSDVKAGVIQVNAEPEVMEANNGLIERWDAHLAPGMYTATKAMDRAIEMAKLNGIGCVAVKNTNHWMRGGTYGWQAADAGCIGICFTNTIANMPPWGGKQARLGNNPLVIAVPRANGHLILDMAMSQFSYGKLQEMSMKNMQLPVPGGFDEEGALTTDPGKITKSWRALPIGFWKGSALSFMLDVVLTAVSGGQSVYKVSEDGKEAGLSQLFLCLHQTDYHNGLMDEIINFTKTSEPADRDGKIFYPGENTLATRYKNQQEGIPVNEAIWSAVLAM